MHVSTVLSEVSINASAKNKESSNISLLKIMDTKFLFSTSSLNRYASSGLQSLFTASIPVKMGKYYIRSYLSLQRNKKTNWSDSNDRIKERKERLTDCLSGVKTQMAPHVSYLSCWNCQGKERKKIWTSSQFKS